MNRIVVGSGSNIEKILNDKVVINVKEDVNLLINNNKYETYEINVNDANVNVLFIEENVKKTNVLINVNKGFAVLNMLSYNLSDRKIEVNLNECFSNVKICNSVIAINKVLCHVKVNHNAKNTTSFIYNNGITKKDGTIKFDVVSFAPKCASISKINQDSKIITLNDVNENEINPVLLIDSFDAEARHAAFIGNFKEEELFYLKSRGLNRRDCEDLLINGLIIGTLDICFDEKEKLKNKLKEEWR